MAAVCVKREKVSNVTTELFVCIICTKVTFPITSCCLSRTNRLFAAGGHMVQNPTYWRAKECARLQNKTQLTRKVWFFVVYISQWSLVTFFCSTIYFYRVTGSSCKGPNGRMVLGQSYLHF